MYSLLEARADPNHTKKSAKGARPGPLLGCGCQRKVGRLLATGPAKMAAPDSARQFAGRFVFAGVHKEFASVALAMPLEKRKKQHLE